MKAERYFAIALALFFVVIFSLGFVGTLDHWEAAGYHWPFRVIFILGVLLIIGCLGGITWLADRFPGRAR
ncbi:MAG TPA: hypothetical protein VMU07_03525 [Candidatus Paceibacterota bacterium]|nr:hypothetical protein [Candidatus Paceibacterota bacterium]